MRVDKLEAQAKGDKVEVRATASMGRYHVLDPQGLTKIDFGDGVVGYAVSDGAIAYEPPPRIAKK